MYAEYFGLKKLPFSITPDPNFVYMSSSHRMAMAQLLYGVQERKPLMVVTGEVGSGKTTMIFTLLSQIDKDAAVSIVFDTQVDPHSLYRYMFADFKISERPADRAEATIILREHLNERMRRNLRTILILDEAHNLSHEILNEVVFLTNMETRQSKLLQIILVGQPELNGILGTQEFRQLRQRISLRTEIKALSYEDTRNYIVHRLREAGSPRPEATFSDEALAQVFRTTIGLPRLINTLCDNAMLTTCARQLKTVEADVIKETARDMEIPSVPKPAPVEHTPAPGAPAHATAPSAAHAATGASAPADEHTPITPRVDSQGNTVVSEDTVEQHEHNGELVRIVRRVLRAPDGREIVKRVRQVRKLTAGATDGEVTPGRRIRAPLIPLAEGIPLARLTPSAQQDLLPALKQDHPAAVRQFHMLWNKIDTISMQEPACTIIVTSAVPKEGKSVCSINLAATIAQTPDVRVLLMDADLHQPRTHEYLGLELPEKGLADILRGQATVADCVINYEIDRFYYLPSGVTEGMPTELLAGRAMDHLLDELKGLFHFVIIDSPPLVPIADTVNLAAKVDGVVLVVRAGQTSRKLVGQVLEDLGEKRILGVVLNGLDFRTSGGAYHYGYYGYYGYYGGYGKRAAARE